jgi:hypothetical protein
MAFRENLFRGFFIKKNILHTIRGLKKNYKDKLIVYVNLLNFATEANV